MFTSFSSPPSTSSNTTPSLSWLPSSMTIHHLSMRSSPLSSSSASSASFPLPASPSLIFPPPASQNSTWIPHADEMDIPGLTAGRAMLAGATAGVMEHICMFPVDTIKTRMQQISGPNYRHVFHAATEIIRHEGFFRLYRGVPATVVGAIPSHSVYFATYEACKSRLGGNTEGYHPIANGISGGVATMAHDAVITPLDVVKQRLQMHKSTYAGVLHCIQRIIKEDGYRAFYASYPTTVLMNVPFMAVHFATYESLKKFLIDRTGHDDVAQHLIAGAGAGALGGIVSNPLDVVKTQIQTSGIDGAPRYTGMREVAMSVWREEGARGFFRGIGARMLYFMPSAAICWTTYEAMKTLLISQDAVTADLDHPPAAKSK